MDIGHNTRLRDLSLDGNGLESIDVSNNRDLIALSLRENRLTEIDVSHNLLLESLVVEDNLLERIDIHRNPGLDQEPRDDDHDYEYMGHVPGLYSSGNPLKEIVIAKRMNIDRICWESFPVGTTIRTVEA